MDPNTLDRLAQAIAARILAYLPAYKGGRTKLKRLFTIDEAGTYLARSRKSLYHLVSRKKIPVVRIDRALRFDRLALDRWVTRRKKK